MKKLIALILIIALAVPAASLADLPDISGLSFDELVQLREKLNLAIWNSEEWQEVTVPVGVWKIGEDIPARKWTIRLSDDATSDWGYMYYCSKLDESGLSPSSDSSVWESMQLDRRDSKENSNPKYVDIDCKEGMYLIIERAPMVFTPYVGKPDLGFK